ncbi:MAG: hypothetical protein J6D20_02615 [Clostridia bacterium]|nr:hypothetical protein [Clostridia bacterium]
MAGTVILRPDEDISGGTGTSYLQICEEVADDSSTKLGGVSEPDQDNDGDYTQTYLFGLNNADIANRVNITDAKIVYRCRINNSTETAKCTISLLCDGNTFFSTSSNTDSDDVYITNEAIFTDILQNIVIEKQHRVPDFQMKVQLRANGGYDETYGEKTSSVYLTQAYVEIVYEELPGIGVHKMVNGAVKAATAAYRKAGGAWAEITEEECKSVLQNNIITEGTT